DCALERRLGEVAKTVGLTRGEVRRRNFIHEGETTATNQMIRENVDMDGLLNRAFEWSDYQAKRERFAKENAPDSDVIERGSSPTVREGVIDQTRGSYIEPGITDRGLTPSLTVGLLPRSATSALQRIKK